MINFGTLHVRNQTSDVNTLPPPYRAGSASPPAAQSSSWATRGNMAGGHGGGPSPPPISNLRLWLKWENRGKSTMENRFTDKTLGIGSQANAAGYLAPTGLASCERSKYAKRCAWTAAIGAENVCIISLFLFTTWTGAFGAENVSKDFQYFSFKNISYMTKTNYNPKTTLYFSEP